MADPNLYDALVVGAGQAGPSVARYLASLGQRVALVERDKLGGTCLNSGCRPTKALRASARAVHVARSSAAHGVTVGDVSFDLAVAMERMRGLVDGWRDGFRQVLASTEGIELIPGHARFTGTRGGQHELQVGERTIRSRHVVLDVGARARVPSIPGLDSIPYLTHESILALDTLPEHLVILGGSYISLEFGQIFRRFGSRVTIVEGGPRLASREDASVSEDIRRFLEEEGVEVHVETQVALVAASAEGGVEFTLQDRTQLTGSHLLLAVGRVPNTDRLGLDTIGLETDARGYIKTDGQFRTPLPGIVALGDVNGRGAFTHTAYQDGEIYIDALKGGLRSADDRITTYAMFTDPPLGRVGMTTREARASGRTVLKASYGMDAVTKAALDGERHGRIEILVDASSEQILGATCLGLFGDEIVQIVSALMHAGAPYTVLQHMLPIHPTVAEFFPTVLAGLAPLDPE